MSLDLLFARVLVADGDVQRVTPMRYTLQEAGYLVQRVGSVAALFRALQENPPDVLFLADTFPDADSYDLVRRLKRGADFPFIPIVLLSNEGDEERIAQAVNAGADEVLLFPLSPATLLLRVRAMIRFKRVNDELRALNLTLEQKVQERTRQLEEAQARLRYAEKLSALGRLAATIAHEINTPISVILTYLYLMKGELEQDSPLREDLSLLEREINRIAELVKRLRSFSKPVQHERKMVSILDVVEDVLRLTGKDLESRRIAVTVEKPETLPLIQASPGELYEVFMNLILNARDAMPEGGQLRITLAQRDAWIEVVIADTGIGIPEELRERIFEPFFTTKGEQGTGLGLAVVYRIIQEHGGDIYVESQADKGATFRFYLPVVESSATGV